MSIESTLGRGEASILRLTPRAFTAKWVASFGDDKTIRRFQKVDLEVAVERNEKLRLLTEQFQLGLVSVFSTEEKPQVDKQGRPALGYIGAFDSSSLNFGLIATPEQVSTLIVLLGRPNAQEFKIEVLPYQNLEDWQPNARDFVHLREWSIVVSGAISDSTSASIESGSQG